MPGMVRARLVDRRASDISVLLCTKYIGLNVNFDATESVM